MIRRPLLAFVALLLAAGDGAAQQPVRILPAPGAPSVGEARLVARLPVPAGIRAASGAISPDGERYVFGALAGTDIQLWMLELRTRELRLLTPGAGRRHDPVWSPDGTRLAYWGMDGLEGIYVLDVAEGRERRVWADSALDAFAAEPRWAGSDSLIFTLNHALLMSEPPHLWVVGAEGGPGRRIERNQVPAHLRTPDPRGGAYFGRCCGGGQEALWVDPPGERAPRCVAGPIGSHRGEAVWAGPAGPIAFSARAHGRDTLFDLFAADPARGGGRQVRAPGRIGGLTASLRGDVALLVHPRPNGPSELWIIPAGRLRGDPRGEPLDACPDPPPEIGAFLREQGVPGVRSVTVLASEPRERLAFFQVVYGEEVDYGLFQSRRGIAYRGRVGWTSAEPVSGRVDEAPAEVFDARAEDRYLFSRELLARLADTDAGREWIGLLLADGDTPDRVLEMLADSAVRTGDVRLANQLFGSPRVQANHRWLAALSAIPWPNGSNPAEGLLWPVAPRAIADPQTPEPILFLIAAQLPSEQGGRADSLVMPVARALAASPAARRSARIQQRLALLQVMGDEPASIRRAAADRLLAHPHAGDTLLHPVVQLLARDSAMAPRLLDAPAVRRSAWLTAQLASPYTRQDVRLRARDRVLADSAAPEAALESLGWMIVQHRDSTALAERILSHPATRGNGPLLAVLVRETLLRAHRRVAPVDPLAARVEALLAEVLRDPRTDERELYRIAMELQSSLATRSAALLLENPRARRCAPILQQVAVMIEFNFTPPAGSHVPDPPAPEVKERAGRLLAELRAGGEPPPCDVGEPR